MTSNSSDFKSYPCLVYGPYRKTLKDKDPQWKDHQRMCLEMMLSFNASVCLANYYHYKTLQDEEEKKKAKAILDKLEGTLGFDMGSMSIGKWNQVTRDTVSKLLKTTEKGKKNGFMVAEIGALYEKSQSIWNKGVDELIKLRNQDAHGQVIDSSRLGKELKKRQGLLDRLMGELTFYKGFQLIVPVGEGIMDGDLVYNCRDLSGEGNGTLTLKQDDLKTEIEHYRTYLYNKKSKACLSLEPMILSYNASQESNEISTFVYNKTIGKHGDLHFANDHESIDLKANVESSIGLLPSPKELCHSFKMFRAQVEDERLIDRKTPVLTIDRNFESKTSIINDEVVLKVTIQNKGDADADNVVTVLEYPRQGFRQLGEEDKEMTVNQCEAPVKIEVPELPAKGKVDKIFKFKAKEEGLYQFDEMSLTYDYLDELDENGEKIGNLVNGINVVTAGPISHQVLDPNDPQSQVPIINLDVAYSDHNPTIGKEVDFIVTASNIGKGIAEDVEIHIFPPPEEMDLISGSTNWYGNINPNDSVERRFTLRPRKQGVFGMKMRDVLYKNAEGSLFKTLAYEDHKILVANDPAFKYRFLLEDAWTDLTVDKDEEARLDRNKEYTKLEDEEKRKIETDVKIKALREVVQQVLGNQTSPIKQITTKGMIGYCLLGCPFLIIDFKEADGIRLLIRGNFKGDGRLTESKEESWQGKYNNVPFHSITLEALGELGDAPSQLKGWIGRAMSYLKENEGVMIQFLDQLGDTLGTDNLISDKRFDYQLVTGKIRKDLVDDLMVQEVVLFVGDEGDHNLIVKHMQMDRMGPALAALGYKNQISLKAGKVDKAGMGITVRLYSESKTGADKTIEELAKRTRRMVLDLAQCRGKLDIEKLENKSLFDKICDHLKENECKFHCREENNGIVFYRGEDLPLYDKALSFMSFERKKGGERKVGLRYMSEDCFKKLDAEKLVEVLRTGDNWFFYKITCDDEKDGKDLVQLVKTAYDKAVQGKPQEMTFGFLKQCMKEKEVVWLKPLLEQVFNQEGSEEVNAQVDGKKFGKITQMTNKLNLAPFLERRDGKIHMVEGNRGLIESVLKTDP